MRQQVAEHGFDRTMADPAHALAAPGLLAQPGPTVRGVVKGAGELFALGPGHAGGFQRALLAVRAGGPVDFLPLAVGPGVVLVKREALTRRAGVVVGGGVVSEAVYFGLLLAKNRYPGRNVRSFEQGVFDPFA